jgi:sterol desaturase/sphingolipid hydroxylase (fatty acid hydroxylase superfamily)
VELTKQIVPSIAIAVLTLGFFVAERAFPGRALPSSKGWYARAVVLNLVQLTMLGVAGLTWNRWFRTYTVVDLGDWAPPILQGFGYWFLLTFVFYWWHRIRHANWFWRVFHQIHHSASRIEVLTSFYKHPIEICANSMIASAFLYSLIGASAEVGAWYAFFAAGGEYFYHCNIKVPRWFRYFIQTPELHSIHHQIDVHRYNFGDITWWDRVFGTFQDAHGFASRCGFHGDREQQLIAMLTFDDVNATSD